MEEFEKIISRREKLTARKEKALQRAVKTLQQSLFSLFLDRVIVNLQTDDDGRLKFNAKNVNRVASSNLIWRSYNKISRGLGKWIVKGLVEVFDLNTHYFNTIATVTDSREERSRQLLFRSLGYDLKKKEIIKDSWLESLISQNEVKRQVMDRLNNALRAKMPIDDFRKQFRNDFLDNKTGLGVVTKNMGFHGQNIFQSFDRATQKVYADDLKLKYAIYSGTKMENTRDFCWRRVNNIYDFETIESWQNDDWQGKIKGSDVFQTAGGYSCRHHFSMLSEEAANLLIKRGKELNKLNPPKPKKKKKK